MLKKRTWFKQLLHRIPLYPFLLAVYPIVNLLALNFSQIYMRNGLMPILISLSATTIIFVVMMLFTRNWQIAGVLTGLLVIWFFVYGHLYNYFGGVWILGIKVGRHRYLFAIWSVLILMTMLWLLIRKKKINSNLTLTLNVVSAVLLSISYIQIGFYYLQRTAVSPAASIASVKSLISWTNTPPLPDIYYIILDGYPRADILESVFAVDDTPFLDSLRQLGFSVAECSQSNYTRTLLSLTSTFNMEYLQTLHPQLTADQNTDVLLPDLKNNLVRRQLEQLGYKTIVFQNPWEGFIWNDAAIVFRAGGYGTLSPFEYLLLNTTVARLYLDYTHLKGNHSPYYTNYIDTLYALEQLQNVPAISGPKFVFAHLVIPHGPFVFDPDGSMIDIRAYDPVHNLYSLEDETRGTIAAVTYINSRMLEILPHLIHDSKTPPIIILASDHGTPIREYTDAVKNLEAFYIPNKDLAIYPQITPVNIFRVIFNEYYNGKFDLLPDHSYFSAKGQYFNFVEVPNTCTPH